MKIAGRKNDGAWYRANKVIQSLTSSEQSALAAKFTEDEDVTQMWQVISDLATEAGIQDADGIPTASENMVDTWTSIGIPRQAWFGRLSYDTYTKEGSGPTATYKPDHQAIMHEGGKAIRKIMKIFVFSRRAALDLANEVSRARGNPGGIADATEDLPDVEG